MIFDCDNLLLGIITTLLGSIVIQVERQPIFQQIIVHRSLTQCNRRLE
jgi:hypothetical protein